MARLRPVLSVSVMALFLALQLFGKGKSIIDTAFLPFYSRLEPESVAFPTLEENPTTNLWLICCETRLESPQLSNWMFTAKQMIERSNSSVVTVRAKNICEHLSFKSYSMKLRQTKAFLDTLVDTEYYNENGTQQEQRGVGGPSDIVMFTDSDTLFNVWAVDAVDVLNRFHRARQGKKIVFSGEPCCWIGRDCNAHDLATLYPNATRSGCVQFLNSGQYAGDAVSMQNMLGSALSTNSVDVPGPSSEDDQARLTYWFRHNQNAGVLDYESSLFRSLMVGAVDPSTRDSLINCGDGPCGLFNQWYSGSVNADSLHIVMEPVPGCSSELRPFSIHGNGYAKDAILRLGQQFLARATEGSGIVG